MWILHKLSAILILYLELRSKQMKHIVKITKKPQLSGKQSVPDGAICGNGDIGLILGSCENGLRVYISKCDLWYAVESHDKGGLRPLGYIDIPVPENQYDNYCVEQDMDNGELRCTFSFGGEEASINIRPCKTENSIMLEITGTGEPQLNVLKGDGESGTLIEQGVNGIYRSFTGEDCVFETHAYAFMKKVESGVYYVAVSTNHDTENPHEYALGKALAVNKEKYTELLKSHYAAWADFWSKSSFETADKELEMNWYASQYLLAGCTGNRNFAPGLYGNFITVEYPMWHSDYHLNYNYQAPFYAACSSNHAELTDCYHTPLEEFMPRGAEFASKFGCRGVIYPVGLMPKGICSEMTHKGLWFDRLFLGQKSNGIHPADIMVFRWNATKDNEYARKHAYPFIKANLEFFEDWLTLENGRYSVTRDAAHEVPYYKDDFSEKKYAYYINGKNGCLTLGMLRLCIPAAVEMAQALGVDADKCEKWNEILEKLAPYPTYYRYGKKVFRYTEKGQSWNDDNDVGLQHIYPGGAVGTLCKNTDLLKIARNTFKQKARYCYIDDNAVCSFFPMAARLGEDPAVIIKKLHELNKKKQLPNMLYNFAGGCLENCSVFANTLNEMVLQGFEGVVRVFPCWDKSVNVSYNSLRADGAFLVSSEMNNGVVSFVNIVSEAGQTLRFENPYKTALVKAGGSEFTTRDQIITLDTAAGEVISVSAFTSGE